MNILFLHGLRENYQDNVILNSLKCLTSHTILAPPLDPWHPKEILEELRLIKSDMCIGFSLGGLFAAALDIPKKILINPALAFTKFLKERRKPKWDKIGEYESFPVLVPQWIRSIFTTEDKTIGLRSLPIYLQYFSEDTITYLSGGHTLNEDQVINTLIPML